VNKILVSVFPTETAAYQGMTALRDLHGEGDITLYDADIIVKDANGQVTLKETTEHGPLGTLVGIVGGSLVGLIGGPAGAAVGAYVGGLGGLLYDMFNLGIGMDFIDEVTAKLTPNTVAIVADIDESWITPVETKLVPLGAINIRQTRDDVIDEQLNRQADELDAELAQLRAEMHETNEQNKATVKAKIEATQQKVRDLDGRITKRLADAHAEFEARMATLKAQRLQAQQRWQADIDARQAELKASYEARKAKLERAHALSKEAAELRKEALAPAR
jgi:uncharacterized membrane protein